MTHGLSVDQRNALRTLGHALPRDAYLAGGVAIALSFGHRTSRDLDFFLPAEFDPARLAEQLRGELSDASFTVTNTAASTLYLELNGIPASVIAYRYPLLAPAEAVPEFGARVASLPDLACMKLAAISQRGAARDFWDLCTLLEHGVAGSLAGALELYRRKFATDDIGHVVRSLAYFGDADAAPLPSGLEPARWNAIKDWFARSVAALD